MADELVIVGYKLNQPIIGDFVQGVGDHVATGVIDQGNSQSYAIAEGVQHLRLSNNSSTAIWFKISTAGSNATADTDEYLGANQTIDRVSKEGFTGKIIKCVNDS